MAEGKGIAAVELHPARVVTLGFCVLILAGTTLLWLPASHAPGRSTTLLDALFTATSAVCVTGLTVVDTAEQWSPLGKAVILMLIQIGGFGIMTLGSLLALVLSNRLGIVLRKRAQVETGSLGIGDLSQLIKVIAAVTVATELVVALVLAEEFHRVGGENVRDALVYGVFHSVSAFNNAGFSLYSDSMVGYVGNAGVILTISAAVVAGGLGFPVAIDMFQSRRRPRGWSLHTKITVLTTVALLVFGFVMLLTFEWGNPGTMGELDWSDKVLTSVFHSVQPRTAGFNSVDVGAMREQTLFATDGLMLVGAGSASTAGGIKVTTFALLAFVIWAEVRGFEDVNSFDRRISTHLQRQALSIALIAVGVVVAGTLALLALSGVPLSAGLFECVSAFGTVGLSTGITSSLDPASKLVLVILMFIGRVGPVTFGAAIVLSARKRRYRLPPEGMIIG